jgi:hypothetical protein
VAFVFMPLASVAHHARLERVQFPGVGQCIHAVEASGMAPGEQLVECLQRNERRCVDGLVDHDEQRLRAFDVRWFHDGSPDRRTAGSGAR